MRPPSAIKNNGHHPVRIHRRTPTPVLATAPALAPAPAPATPPHRVTVFEIHTDLPVWMLDAVHDLLIILAKLTGSKIDFAIVTESYHDQAASATT